MMVAGIAILLSFVDIKQMSQFSKFFSAIAIFVLVTVISIIVISYNINSNIKKMYNIPQDDFEFEKPFLPHFLLLISTGTGMYEGIPIVPKVFSNAKDQSRFIPLVTFNVIINGLIAGTLSIYSVLLYRGKTQESILSNVNRSWLTSLQNLTIIQMMAFNAMPVFDIIKNVRDSAFQRMLITPREAPAQWFIEKLFIRVCLFSLVVFMSNNF